MRQVHQGLPQGELAEVQDLHRCGEIPPRDPVGHRGRPGQQCGGFGRNLPKVDGIEALGGVVQKLAAAERVGDRERSARPRAVADRRGCEAFDRPFAGGQVVLQSQRRLLGDRAAKEDDGLPSVDAGLTDVRARNDRALGAVWQRQDQLVRAPAQDTDQNLRDDLLPAGVEVPGHIATQPILRRALALDSHRAVAHFHRALRRKGELSVRSLIGEPDQSSRRPGRGDGPGRRRIEVHQRANRLGGRQLDGVVAARRGVGQRRAGGDLVDAGLCRRETQPAVPCGELGPLAVDGNILPGALGG